MKKLKIATVLGARPQFIKAAAVSRAINESFSDKIQEIIIHTGQHFDPNMSDSFFEQLNIPQPDYNLKISGGSHGDMTGRMLCAIEEIYLREKPDWVLVYGDTNSTLAGALAASKLHIPIAHVEAGLRSFNKRMPEEVNRVLTDHISELLFCPTHTAVHNLKNEGIVKGVYEVGDVMYDVSLFYQEKASKESNIHGELGVSSDDYVLVTCHRQENTDVPERLENIVLALADIAQHMKVVFPIHPRTRKMIEAQNLLPNLKNVIVTEPLSYLDMMALEQKARVILTDSGGVQKEAYFCRVPCVTVRDQTEWTETVDLGCNTLVEASRRAIVDKTLAAKFVDTDNASPYGNAHSSKEILSIILQTK